jgi:membrane-bound serine protease (ClpP class)
VEALLLTIGFLAIVVLALTPWTKTGTVVAVGAIVGYFYYVGVDGWTPILLFGLGLFLLGLEIFIPDFGLLGILGILSIGLGLYYTTGDIAATIRDLTIALVTSVGLIYLLIRDGYSLSNFDKIVLKTQSANKEGNRKEAEDKEQIKVGMAGTAVTPLRPSGKASFGEDTPAYDVLSSEGHISAGEQVVIQEIRGTKIVVRLKKS